MKKKKPVSVPLSIEQLQGTGYHVFVHVKVNGKKCRFLIDTGASHSVISKAYYEKKLGKKKLKTVKQATTGLHSSTSKSHFGDVAKLSLGKLTIDDITLAAIDLSHVNETYKELKKKKIDGIIGSDLLRKQNAVIDYGQAVLLLIP